MCNMKIRKHETLLKCQDVIYNDKMSMKNTNFEEKQILADMVFKHPLFYYLNDVTELTGKQITSNVYIIQALSLGFINISY